MLTCFRVAEIDDIVASIYTYEATLEIKPQIPGNITTFTLSFLRLTERTQQGQVLQMLSPNSTRYLPSMGAFGTQETYFLNFINRASANVTISFIFFSLQAIISYLYF